mgnify:CR=1 FL=1
MDAALDRFIKAQNEHFPQALAEIRSCKKRSHWMWFIFPQLDGLGSSSMARHYGIRDIEEAGQFLQHPLLGSNLLEITRALYDLSGKTAEEVFGYPDHLKLRSSMTLFAQIEESNAIFQQVLSKYFDGKPDPLTLQLLDR